jgi:hypothetical protein
MATLRYEAGQRSGERPREGVRRRPDAATGVQAGFDSPRCHQARPTRYAPMLVQPLRRRAVPPRRGRTRTPLGRQAQTRVRAVPNPGGVRRPCLGQDRVQHEAVEPVRFLEAEAVTGAFEPDQLLVAPQHLEERSASTAWRWCHSGPQPVHRHRQLRGLGGQVDCPAALDAAVALPSRALRRLRPGAFGPGERLVPETLRLAACGRRAPTPLPEPRGRVVLDHGQPCGTHGADGRWAGA